MFKEKKEARISTLMWVVKWGGQHFLLTLSSSPLFSPTFPPNFLFFAWDNRVRWETIQKQKERGVVWRPQGWSEVQRRENRGVGLPASLEAVGEVGRGVMRGGRGLMKECIEDQQG